MILRIFICILSSLVFFFAILMIVLSGCKTDQKKNVISLTGNEQSVTQDILQHISIGSSINDAKNLMEQDGFECSFDQSANGTFLFCVKHKNVDSFVSQRWRVIIYHENNIVTSVVVRNGLVGM